MPGLLHHNLMPEDRADKIPATTPSTQSGGAGDASASAPPAPVATWECRHDWKDHTSGGKQCAICWRIVYPQQRLF